MSTNWKEIARAALAGAEADTISFPESVKLLMEASFDAVTVKDAIREAQALAPGYTYRGFCDKVAAAGCAGYIVSFPGKRVLYHGRTAETHTEYFPGARANGR